MSFEEDNASSTVQLHSRRLGREFAMQFLCQNDLAKDEVKPEILDNFFEGAAANFDIPENRPDEGHRHYTRFYSFQRPIPDRAQHQFCFSQ